MSEDPAAKPEDEQPAAATLRWRSHPVVDDFPRSLLLVGIVVGVSVLAGFAFGGAGYGLLAVVVLAVSLTSYFVPTDFELDDDGVTVRILGRSQRVAWARVRRYTVHREGVHLSPFAKPSRLDSFRGTFLRFAGNADEVVSFVEGKAGSSR